MAKIPKEKRVAQLVLFWERHNAPHWQDLAETTRFEAVRLLAQLLRTVRATKLSPAPQNRGGCDE
jgi:hypothetical protein